MSEQLPASPPWNLIAKKNAGAATPDELATLAHWLAHYTLPVADGLDQIDITFEDEETMAAWLRMQQRSKRLAMSGASWLVTYENSLLPIRAAEVAHFTSRPGRVTLATLSGQTYALALTLDELETTVESRHFFRATEQALIARAGIAQTAPLPDGSLQVQLQPVASQQVVIPKARAAEFNAWLGSI